MPLRVLLLLLTLSFAHGSPLQAQAQREIAVMGTLLRGSAEADVPEAAREALEAGLREVERFDRLLSTWDASSPMSALNAAPLGVQVTPPRELAGILEEAEAWAVRTGRAFDPTVGALVDAWKLRAGGERPGPAALDAALRATGPEAISIDAASGAVTRHARDAWVDTGAFGKGAALRACADTLRAHGVRRALLDLGGQVLALAAPEEAPWEVAVADPRRRDVAAALLRVSNASAATSGNSERGLLVDGVRVGHILDPRTGAPAPWWGSVTVVAADPLVADVLSTALYVMGPEAGMAWARDLPDVGALFLVESDGKIQTLHNQAMARWLVEPPADAGTHQPSSPERRIP